MKDIQDWLGLSSYATTANIYAHLDTDSKKQPATKMNQTVSITPGISAAIQAGGENSGREPGFKKKILRFSIHEKPEYFQLQRTVKIDIFVFGAEGAAAYKTGPVCSMPASCAGAIFNSGRPFR